MSWGIYLLGMVGVVVGLMVVEQISPSLVGGYVLMVLLAVALAHPTFLKELRELVFGGQGGQRPNGGL